MKFRTITVSALLLSLIVMGYPQSAQQRGGTETPSASRQRVYRASAGNTQSVTGKRRSLPRPQDPEAVALFIHLMDRYARSVSDKTDLDRRIEQELSKRPGSRESAKRIVANFERIPLAERRRAFGKWASLAWDARISLSQYSVAFERLARSAKKPLAVTKEDEHPSPSRVSPSAKHRRSESAGRNSTEKPAGTPQRKNPLVLFSDPEPEPFGRSLLAFRTVSSSRNGTQAQRNRYSLRYEGMWCHSETDDDHGSASDEVYLITAITDSRGRSWTTRHPQPRAPEWYEDIDDNVFRVGPRRRCWGGADGQPAEDLTLTVAAFEHDDGDPEELELLFLEGLALLQVLCGVVLLTGGPLNALACELIGLAFIGLITGAIAIFTGGEDDPLSVETVTIRADQIRDWGDDPPASSRRGNIPYHFRTIHNGDGNAAGADYHLYFSIDRIGG